MEFEQIVKRLDWLDNEHRKDKEALSVLKEQATSLKTTVNANTRQIKDLSKQMSEVSTAAVRLNQFDEIMSKQRSDLNKALENLEKKYQRREADANKRHQAELDALTKAVAEFRTVASPAEFKKLRERGDETLRLTNNVEDLRK